MHNDEPYSYLAMACGSCQDATQGGQKFKGTGNFQWGQVSAVELGC